MAWRPHEQLIEGELDNTIPRKVTGWMRFAGMNEKVVFDLEGDFHRDIRGTKIRFKGNGREDDPAAKTYMEGFSARQTGKVGDMTAGNEPADYVDYPYYEWYSQDNGRVVLELEPDRIEIIGTPIPAIESDPVSREQQGRNMAAFMSGVAREVATAQTATTSPAHDLLPEEIRQQLPPLYAQDGKGGEAIAYLKLFTPSSGWTWYITEGSPEGDDFLCFGLVDGMERELGYISLNELKGVKGPLGLPIERDLHWQPTPLKQIAPEMFTR